MLHFWLIPCGILQREIKQIQNNDACGQVCELPIAMLACARIGAVHTVVFGGFSAESLAQRCADCRCACASNHRMHSMPFVSRLQEVLAPDNGATSQSERCLAPFDMHALSTALALRANQGPSNSFLYSLICNIRKCGYEGGTQLILGSS